MHKLFRFSKVSETHKVSSTKFSALWNKKFSTGDRDITPLLSVKVFDTSKILKHCRISKPKSSTLSDKKFWRKTAIHTPVPSSPWKFLTPESFRNQEGSPNGIFWYSETKNTRRSFVISPSYAKKISNPEDFWHIEKIHRELFWHCETKKYQRKKVIPPPSFLWNTSISEIFRYWKSRQRTFLVLNKKRPKEHRDIPLLRINFSIPEFFGNTEGLFYDFFRHCQTKKT